MNGSRDVFVSFDWDNDRRYKFLLEAWRANPQFKFTFDDASTGEIQSNEIHRVKAALTLKIRTAKILLVLVGKEANKPHRDRAQIGYVNWQNFEIAKAKEAKMPIVAVKLDRSNELPTELTNAGASWAMSFTEESIMEALRRV